ncbi:MAG: tRNA (adenosine(37)-N6)-threonylcarbamoyltransferase complex dimerization subunit type 1 TsaB [Thermodesulforhabdaceae bacterium]
MKLLAVDTSTWVESVAVLDNGDLLAEKVVLVRETHNRRLLETIDKTISDAGISLKDIDLFAVGVGPGSFTGIRIGITTVKALAWSLNKPIIGISSLDALATLFSFVQGYVCPMIDARKREVYYALYEADGSGRLRRESFYKVATPRIVAQEITEKGIKKVFFCGDGWRIYKDYFLQFLNCTIIDPPGVFNSVKASFIGASAWQSLVSGVSPSSSFELVPIYVRPSEAELKRGTS